MTRQVPTGGESPRSRVLEGAQRLADRGSYLFFRYQAHFHNPMVPKERDALAEEPALDDPEVAAVVQTLVERGDRLPLGIYSPVPIARAVAEGTDLESLLEQFRYEMIHVDGAQEWRWKGRAVAPKIRQFFLENTHYEPALSLWFFEYRVNDEWWDKSYFSGLTPLKVTVLDEDQLAAVLSSGRRDTIDSGSFRLDAEERLFVDTGNSGGSAGLGHDSLLAVASRERSLRRDSYRRRLDAAGLAH